MPINYETYRKYLCAIQDSYRKRKDLSGIGILAKKFGVTHLTKEQFFEFNLAEGEITMERATKIRNEVSKRNIARNKERQKKREAEKNANAEVEFNLESLRLPYPLFSSIVKLKPSESNPYKFALQTPPCDNLVNHITPVESPVIQKLLEAQLQNGKDDGITFFGEFTLPTICDANDPMLHQIKIGVAKFGNNGTTYWLCKSDIILKLLAWVSSYYTNEFV